jgi:hypothetical protein
MLKIFLLFSAVVALGFAFANKPSAPPPADAASDGAGESVATEAPRNSVVGGVLNTLRREAQTRRQARSQDDPDFLKRINPDLMEGRINFILYGYGETHEPPLTEKATIGSVTIASIEPATNKVNLISFTHDIRAPEVERYQAARGMHDGYPIKMHRAYPIGGFDLMRETMENATGMPIDFQIAFSEATIAEVVDDVFGGVPVNVPVSFDVAPFYLDGVKYEGRHFEQGEQIMDGATVIQFIKTVPIPSEGAKYYGRALEHNARKHLVFQGMLKWLDENSEGPGFFLALIRRFKESRDNGSIAFDFELEKLFIKDLGGMASIAKSLFVGAEETLPEIARTVYVVDSAHGDGGVQWVNASQSPAVKAEIEAGRYPDRAIEVPINANPQGDLPTEYWPSVRALVKKTLLGS